MTPMINIVFSSPAGSTGHVARIVETTLSAKGAPAAVLDLKAPENAALFGDRVRAMLPGDFLFVGSPVYRDLAVPPVMRFVADLPDNCRGYAVPFVTWGGAFSGIALWQMGTALAGKGFALAGAAKVLGLHSMMWRSASPVGQGHPDGEDDRAIAAFVLDLWERSRSGGIRPLDPSVLDYHPPHQTETAKAKRGKPWVVVPKTVDERKCTACGVCVEVCPAGAVDLDPFPVIAPACFDCFNCVRLCPEDAIAAAVSAGDIEHMILDRVRTFNETPPTRIFVA